MFNPLPRVHDARLVGHIVDGELQRITFRLRPESTSAELFLLRFDDVFAYSFKHANLVSVISNIYQIPTRQLISEQWPSLSEGMRLNGWPEQFPSTQEEAIYFLQSRYLHAYIIESSIGISGWVLAVGFGFWSEHA